MSYFDWELTPKTKALAKQVYELHEKGLTFPMIAKALGHHRVYVTNLNSWHKKQLKQPEEK